MNHFLRYSEPSTFFPRKCSAMEKYTITLELEERELVQQLTRKARAAARKVAQAQILLKADSSGFQARSDAS